jgi:3-carboxy-cis,cis-muconate cycloisomerase
MPHKANPTHAILVRSAAIRAPGLVGTVFAAAAGHEHQRAAGAWHAEWEPLRELLSLTGGAALRLGAALDGVRVDPERMRTDLDLTGGLLLSESVAAALAPSLGRDQAHELVRECVQRATAEGQPFAVVLRDEPRVRKVLDDDALASALDPTHRTGSTDALIDRALEAHARRS